MDQSALISAIATLVWACVVALAATALTIILRNAPVVRDWVQEAKKPWACNVCMPLYACAVVVAGLCVLYGRWEYALTYLPAYLLAKTALDKLTEPSGPPPAFGIPADSDVDPLEEDLSDTFVEVDTDPRAIPPVLRSNRRV